MYIGIHFFGALKKLMTGQCRQNINDVALLGGLIVFYRDNDGRLGR